MTSERSRPSVSVQAATFLESLTEQIAINFGLENGSYFDDENLFQQTLFSSMNSKIQIVKKEQNRDLQNIKPTNQLVIGIPILSFGSIGPNRPDVLSTQLIDSAKSLTENGVGVYMLPSYYRFFRQGALDKWLAREGIYIQAIINTPARYLMPYAGRQPIFIVVAKKRPNLVFALDCQTYESINLYLSNFFTTSLMEDIRTGTRIDLNDFKGFEHWYVQREIAGLEGDFGNYARHELSELSLFINVGRAGVELEDMPNSVYLPMIGNGEAVSDYTEMSMKHQNYCQIVADTTKTTAEYLCGFLNSRHFRMYLEAEKSAASHISPRLRRDQIQKLPIALPDIEIQTNIGLNMGKLSRLRSLVNELSQNISVNPIQNTSMSKQVDEVLSVFGKLTTEERVLSLLREGESKTLEFKQTYSLEIKDNTKQKYIEDSALKTIAAFLNTDGGILLIGVDDAGDLVGVEREIESLHQGSRDKFLLNFKNRFKSMIGEQFYPVIEYELIEIMDKLVFQVICKRSELEVYIEDKAFYVRANPATDKLEGRKLSDYIRQRFP